MPELTTTKVRVNKSFQKLPRNLFSLPSLQLVEGFIKTFHFNWFSFFSLNFHLDK